MSETFNEHLQSEELEANIGETASDIFSNQEISVHEDPETNREEVVSPEESQEVLEQREAHEAAEALAEHMNQTDGTTYTAEDLMNGPESATWVSRFVEEHPRARKLLNVFMLSTALAGAAAPHEAKADMLGDVITTVVRGSVQQGSAASQQRIYQEQAADRQAAQRQQEQMRAQQAHQDMINRQQMQQEDLAHRHAMRDIKDPYVREKAELDYRQQKERRMEVINQTRQQGWRENQEQAQEEQRKQQQIYQQRQIQVNTQNQVIQQGTNHFLQSILMKH
jgi:hypothetical protein